MKTNPLHADYTALNYAVFFHVIKIHPAIAYQNYPLTAFWQSIFEIQNMRVGLDVYHGILAGFS